MLEMYLQMTFLCLSKNLIANDDIVHFKQKADILVGISFKNSQVQKASL